MNRGYNEDGATRQYAGHGITEPSSDISDLIFRAKNLLSELEAFRERLRKLRQEGTVELASFRSTVQSELGMLERLSIKSESEETNHIARSSNLLFLETVWFEAKKSKDLVALQKRVYLDSHLKALSQGMRGVDIGGPRGKKDNGCKDNGVLIDLMADGGRTWTKVSLVTNRRLLFDLAKQGWEFGDSDSEDGAVIAPDSASEDDNDVPLLKATKELTRASKRFRVRTKHPSVRLILPRIFPGETPEIDDVLQACRDCGATVVWGNQITPPNEITHSLDTMATDPTLRFSTTLNIDCTILLALVSEFSHAKVTKEAWFHNGLKRQVEIEDKENLLPSMLYPALGNHKLVCTQEAANRMREIVATIGTLSEKARTAVLMGDDKSKSQQQLVEEMQQWSAYEVLQNWQLPIVVVDQEQDGCQSNLSHEAGTVCKNMTAINKSVFLYGWATGQTTITSNRVVVKQIENELEKYEDLDDDIWPKIWLCPTARSLVGKEKRGAKKHNSEEPAMRYLTHFAESSRGAMD